MHKRMIFAIFISICLISILITSEIHLIKTQPTVLSINKRIKYTTTKTELKKVEIVITKGNTTQTFTGYVSQGYDSEKHAFTVDSSVVRIEVYLYMPSGTDFDLSVWDPNGYRTGGWTSSDHTVRTDIPNSQYSGYSANPEYVIVDPVTTTGTWYTGCYAYSGSGNYEIKVVLYYDSNYKSAIDQALANVEYFSDSYAADIYHFAYLIQQYISNTTIQNYAQAVMDALTAAIIYEAHGSGHPNAHGLDVYFPKTSSDYNSSYTTSGLDFVADTYWDEFLNAYYSA